MKELDDCWLPDRCKESRWHHLTSERRLYALCPSSSSSRFGCPFPLLPHISSCPTPQSLLHLSIFVLSSLEFPRFHSFPSPFLCSLLACLFFTAVLQLGELVSYFCFFLIFIEGASSLAKGEITILCKSSVFVGLLENRIFYVMPEAWKSDENIKDLF